MGNTELVRNDGRTPQQLREITMEIGWNMYAEGSVLISFGNTKVLCNASFTEGVPKWLMGQGKGWVSAEYAMLPRATQTRSQRESVQGKLKGRTHEISRLIGRSLRSVIDLRKLGENTITIDCEVLQADGGTRTAAITGAYIACEQAIRNAQEQGILSKKRTIIREQLAAVSVGILHDQVLTDLNYYEDSRAETDMNIVMGSSGNIVEVQGTGEQHPFSMEQLQQMVERGREAIMELCERQRLALDSFYEGRERGE